MEEEIWKPIDLYGRGYLVSNFGKVKSMYWTTKTGKIVRLPGIVLKTSINDRGYEIMSVYNSITKKSKRPTIHRLVCTLFHPNPENKPQVNHKDLNQLNNHYENLEWVTAKENTIHAHKNGACKKIYKYSDEQILKIREQVTKHGAAFTSRSMGIHYSVVYNIATYNRGIDGRLNISLPNRIPLYKKVENTLTGVVSDTDIASKDLGISRRRLVRMLSGEIKNSTCYKYL